MHDTVAALSQGTAAVVVVTQEFETLAQVVASRAGWPGMRMLVLPYPLVDQHPEQLREVAREYFRPLLRTCGLPD